MTLLLLFAGSLAVGTYLESAYDTKTARYWVYFTPWFFAILALLGVNIFCVALSRWPWKRKHLPFLLAHAGILILLTGSWITYHYGLDGSLVVKEEESSPAVEIDEEMLVLMKDSQAYSVKIPWHPQSELFKPLRLPEYGLVVDRLIPHADQRVEFAPAPESAGSGSARQLTSQTSPEKIGPALKITLQSNRIGINQNFWLWAGDGTWAQIQMGPARFVIKNHGEKPGSEQEYRNKSVAEFSFDEGGALVFRSFSQKGTHKKSIVLPDRIVGFKTEPGWMEMTLKITDFIPKAVNHTQYRESRMKTGTDAPPPAIRISTEDGGAQMWLGLGEQGMMRFADSSTVLQYTRKRKYLPFGIYLNRFQVDFDLGTRNPAAYSSLVKVIPPPAGQSADATTLISMNEPLVHAGYTFYQASFVPGEPRPTITVLSVNRDPGRELKYWGSLLLVLGSSLLFAVKYLKSSRLRRWMGVEGAGA